MKKHPEKEWSVDSITRSMGLSKPHFHRMYKATPHKELLTALLNQYITDFSCICFTKTERGTAMKLRDRLIGAAALLACIGAAAGSASFFESRQAGESLAVSAQVFAEELPVIILDAGHGGSS